MEIPIVVINIVSAIIIGLVAYIFKSSLSGKIDENKTDADKRMDKIEDRIDAIEDSFKECSIAINNSIERRGAQHDATIKDAIANLTPRTHCDSKQELWQLKFDTLLRESQKEHKNLELTLQGITDMVQEVSDCVQKLARGKECEKI